MIGECVEHGEIHLEFLGTQDQLADILTKPLAKVRFQDLCKRIGVTKLSLGQGSELGGDCDVIRVLIHVV
jgi:hypothetical protein